MKRIVWNKCGKNIVNRMWKKCGKEYYEKSVKNMWKAITWENCEKNSVEKNSMVKVWKTITRGKSVEKL